jgi:hypothetical protein
LLQNLNIRYTVKETTFLDISILISQLESLLIFFCSKYTAKVSVISERDHPYLYQFERGATPCLTEISWGYFR